MSKQGVNRAAAVFSEMQAAMVELRALSVKDAIANRQDARLANLFVEINDAYQGLFMEIVDDKPAMSREPLCDYTLKGQRKVMRPKNETRCD